MELEMEKRRRGGVKFKLTQGSEKLARGHQIQTGPGRRKTYLRLCLYLNALIWYLFTYLYYKSKSR